MTRVSELTGALLDYYVALAEGIPAEQLTIRQVQRSDSCHVVRCWTVSDLGPVNAVVLAYSTDWAQCGPLAEKHDVFFESSNFPRLGSVFAYRGWRDIETGGGAYGSNRMQAICRAVVRAAFGDEVEDVPLTKQ